MNKEFTSSTFFIRQKNHDVSVSSPKFAEDGLGLHSSNMNPLITYYKHTPPGYYQPQHENNQHYQHQQPQLERYISQTSSSQFYPSEINDYNLRRCSTLNPAATNQEPLISAVPTATTAIVRPEDARKCYSTSSNKSTTKKVSQRHSMSTTVPAIFNDMRGQSIDKNNYDVLNYSEVTPRTSRPSFGNNRQLSHSNSDFHQHARRRKSLQKLNENSSTDSATMGSQYSHPPRKPAPSVVELPSVPIQPHLYSSDISYRKSSNEANTPNGYDISSNFQPQKSSTPRNQYDDDQWITPSHRFFPTTTTFGTEPHRKSTTYLADNNAFNPEESHTRRPLSTEIHASQQQFDDNNSSHSPMSNSGNSSAATTTTTTDTIMPKFFNNGSNKVAVAPQPQKRSSQSNRHSSTVTKEEIPRFRTHISHSPYQSNPIIQSNGITSSRSGHRLNRLSSEVFIDGPPPSTPNGFTDVRVSLLEDKVRSLETELSGRNRSTSTRPNNISLLEDKVRNLETELSGRNHSTSSRQNMTFNAAPTEAQRLMMQEIIEKDCLIGQLKSGVQYLAGQLERKQMEIDEEKLITQKEKTKVKELEKVIEELNAQITSTTLNASTSCIKPELITPQYRKTVYETLSELDTEDEDSSR
jgi:hypothetical protein